ncbi:MAG: hypothetical protein QG670_1968 [Thermoproteota archaeon]|nr:hypothetical protein [Thermoproteota archaeon]
MTEIPSLYLYSTGGYCGKSALCLGLALRLKDEGFKVGYFKPIGWETIQRGERIDEDAQLMNEALNLNLPLNIISPIVFGPRYLEEIVKVDPSIYEKRINQSYEKASINKDLMIIEGPRVLGIGASIGADTNTLAKRFKSNLILVSIIEDDSSIDRVIWRKTTTDARGAAFAGVILNSVPKTMIERVKGIASTIMKRSGVNILGIIPDNIELRSLTVREICENVDCQVLTGEDKLENLIEDFLIGAMTQESALKYFRRSIRKAVITGGDRVDIQLAALQTDTSVLILTGNIYPDVRVLARAEEVGIPVILVPLDTYSTIRNISTLSGRINPRDSRKIDLAKKEVDNYIRLDEIFRILKLK